LREPSAVYFLALYHGILSRLFDFCEKHIDLGTGLIDRPIRRLSDDGTYTHPKFKGRPRRYAVRHSLRRECFHIEAVGLRSGWIYAPSEVIDRTRSIAEHLKGGATEGRYDKRLGSRVSQYLT
jgi:hypothetical protein